MALADAEMWLGILLLVLWCVAAFAAVRPGRRRLPGPRRRTGPVVAGAGVAAVLFTAQAGVVDQVADSGPATTAPFDGPALNWFVAERTPARTWLCDLIGAVAGTAGMAVLAALGAAALWWYGHRRPAMLLLVATGGAGLLVVGFKALYGRARPPVAVRLAVETNASLPSGHTLGSIVVLGMLAAIAIHLTHSGAVRVAAVVLATTGAAAIGVSRLYLGVHWLSDVLTGWLLGGAWLAVCVTVLVLWTPQGRAHPSDTTRAVRTWPAASPAGRARPA